MAAEIIESATHLFNFMANQISSLLVCRDVNVNISLAYGVGWNLMKPIEITVSWRITWHEANTIQNVV